MSVALSGGADSAALGLLALESGGDDVRAVHVHHGLRWSDRLSSAASLVADQLGVPLSVAEVEVSEGSPEAAAREARYRVLSAVDGQVVTGHTKDDSAETVLINLIRGTGAGGLGGIPWHRPPNVYRPLLEVSRSETREIATLAGLDFFDDPMNDDLDLLRASVRRRIIPELEALNPAVVENLTRMSQTVRRDHEYLAAVAASAVPGPRLSASLVLTLPRPIADRVVASFLSRMGAGVGATNIAKVRAVAAGEAASEQLGSGLVVELRATMLEIR